MKSFSPQLSAEKAKQNVISFWFIAIGDYYFTSCPKNYIFNSITYQYCPLEISAIKISDGDTSDGCEIRLNSVDLTVAALVLYNSFKYATVTIEEVWFDINMQIIDSEIVFRGKVDGRPSLDEQGAIITVAPHNNFWQLKCPGIIISKYTFPNMPERGTRIAWGDTIITIK